MKMKMLKFEEKKMFSALLRWFLTYATNSKHAKWEMETHLLNKIFNVANTELM